MQKRPRLGVHSGAGEYVDEEAEGLEVGAVGLVVGGELEEGEGGGGVEAEAAEEGVSEVVGELE